MTVRRGYALAALAILLAEIAIALWVRDRVIRPFGGDVLAVLLVYCALRAVAGLRIVPAAALAVVAGFAVEASQAVHLVDRLGLGGNRLARTVFGTSFAVTDLLAYVVGGTAAVAIERWRR